MQIIVITLPYFFTGEALRISNMLAQGHADRIHLRKPDSTSDDCRRLLDTIGPQWFTHIVIHDHFELCAEYGLRGVHLNRRNPSPPAGHHGTLSCSCHSLEEVVERKPMMDYVFLSPIYDSISKQGYRSKFTDEMLRKAAAEGIIDKKVVALGGVTFECIPHLEEYGFGGAALLGDAWKQE